LREVAVRGLVDLQVVMRLWARHALEGFGRRLGAVAVARRHRLAQSPLKRDQGELVANVNADAGPRSADRRVAIGAT
jgi:hypothetical protein